MPEITKDDPREPDFTVTWEDHEDDDTIWLRLSEDVLLYVTRVPGEKNAFTAYFEYDGGPDEIPEDITRMSVSDYDIQQIKEN